MTPETREREDAARLDKRFKDTVQPRSSRWRCLDCDESSDADEHGLSERQWLDARNHAIANGHSVETATTFDPRKA